ncbi:MAG: Eco57I restriction-modification methylase domain-containing protein [Methylococcales bacterium]|nr:Eco57I restriction-modification methylase domain-containing protein [Methylococcales bacterium]
MKPANYISINSNKRQSLDSKQQYLAMKSMARGYAEELAELDRLSIMHAFCISMMSSYWDSVVESKGAKLKIKKPPFGAVALDSVAIDLATQIGKIVSHFPAANAGYLIGSVYTIMLPEQMRSTLGAFYTPPSLSERLIDLAISAGFDPAKHSACDPSCGGGAFLSPVAARMLQATPQSTPELTLRRIASRLRGNEIDPFAAWISEVLLEVTLLDLIVASGKRMPDVVTVGDSLNLDSTFGTYDLVIGNPPYGRTTLTPSLREKFSRSLFGHANLYGVFTDLALNLCKPNGVIAYVTPTSFLGGQYFKALRELLCAEAPAHAIDIVFGREGVFDGVLQETALTTYCRNGKPVQVSISQVTTGPDDVAEVTLIGKSNLDTHGGPWLLPRSKEQASFFDALRMMDTRLTDLGYDVSTGPLVWNRHKDQLKTSIKGKNTYPLIWAESIASSKFVFSAVRKNHAPAIKVLDNQEHLLTKTSCVLVQRTTSKEQVRRLISAVLPKEFLNKHGAVVVENHINSVYPVIETEITPETMAVLFNSQPVDAAFRCISGSVAVSAYELKALPLPTLQQMKQLQALIQNKASSIIIENTIKRYYGISA